MKGGRELSNDRTALEPNAVTTTNQSSPIVRQAIAHGLGLTNRELEVLECLAEGMTQKETAEELKLSYTTVQNYTVMARIRLNAVNVAHAVTIGFRRGFLK